ncbi:MAG TPA: hypothetical protein PK156_19970 [Polyangium sp.]|nr:hypothetical protein [Polyangium sp.]
MSKINSITALSFIVSAASFALLMGSSGCAVDSTTSSEISDQPADDNGETIVDDDDQAAYDDETTVDSVEVNEVTNQSAENDAISQYCILAIPEDGEISAADRRCYASEEERLIGEGPGKQNTRQQKSTTQQSVTTWRYVGDWYEHNDLGGAHTTIITTSDNCPSISDIPSFASGWNDIISSFRYDPSSNSGYSDLGCNLIDAYEHSNYVGYNFYTQFMYDGCIPIYGFSSYANTQINVSEMGYWTSSCGQYCSQVETLNDRISSIKYARACPHEVGKHFDRTNTSSATVNYESIPFALERSAIIKATTSPSCGPAGAYTVGDSYIRLYNTDTNQQVAYNDDTLCSGNNSLASYFETTVSPGNYELRVGCWSSNSCSGKAVVSIFKQYP